KVMNSSSDKKSWIGHILSLVGLKNKDQVEKAQVKNIIDQVERQKDLFSQYLGDQRRYLAESREQMGSLSLQIKEMMDRDSNADLFRLKDLTKQMEDQTTLLIDQGKQIEEFNEQQKKLNQKVAQDADVASFVSNSDRNRFVDSFKDGLNQQQDFMRKQMQKTQELKSRMQQIQNQIKEASDQGAFKSNSQMADKMESQLNKVQSVLDDSKDRQQRLMEINQRNMTSIDSMSRKMDDIKRKNQDFMNQNKTHVGGQAQSFNNRIQDQLEKAKDRNRR
ncbi:MAG: hypothetical protein WCH62_05585, partial [Candidatus Omnitrophota bacterium]